ncbi:hypothetical protein [Mesorhizobium shangrilense]|uniref:hypothetical protein n=1 Tax=Mesorhizobium shangrilense TaxID=460060 RepID=UPI003F498828
MAGLLAAYSALHSLAVLVAAITALGANAIMTATAAIESMGANCTRIANSSFLL